MSDDDGFVPDYIDYSDEESEKPEFTVILDEDPCETLVVGEGDDREVFVVIDDIHRKRPAEVTKGPASKGKRKLRSVVLATARAKVNRSRKSRLRRRNLVRCSLCKKRTSHLKKHFTKHHVARRYWFLNPDKACWKCSRHEIDIHIRNHGPFSIRRHMSRFSKLLSGFLRDIKRKLGLSSDRSLLRFVQEKRLGTFGSMFNARETAILDALDDHLGLEKTKRRNCAAPKRVSSVLHWRTLGSPLAYQAKKKQPGKQLPPPKQLPPKEHSLSFIDSHCHLDRLYRRTGYKGSFTDYLRGRYGSSSSNLLFCVTNFCDPKEFPSQDTWKLYESSTQVFATVGCHPKKVDELTESRWRKMRQLLTESKTQVLGEIGLDYSDTRSGSSSWHQQRRTLRRLLDLAVQCRSSVVIHCREAFDDLFRICKEVLSRTCKIHLHCCTFHIRQYQKFTSYFKNVYVGVTPLVTYKGETSSADARNLVRHLPLSCILLETDAPYFMPKQLRKLHQPECSDPTMAIHAAREIAALKNVSVETVLRHSTRNARIMYSLP